MQPNATQNRETPLTHRILRAAHCRSVHHFFALDALPMIGSDNGKRLAKLLLKYHSAYLTGAKDPDKRFRDFQNHVVHVDDGYWGGAPRVAHQWYDRLQKYLRQERYRDAAHAAGVLSHYFTDPIQPLHTAQSPTEKVLHRPIEWSVTCCYDELFQKWQADPTRIVFQMSDTPGWLGEAILRAARVANEKYEPLLSGYDLVAGKKDPPAGLNPSVRAAIVDLIGLAVTGWARVLERAARDAEESNGRSLPNVGLTLAATLAGIQTPHRVWLRRIESKKQRNKVASIIQEFEATGNVVENLPSEVRVVEQVRKVYAGERVFARRRQELQNQKAAALAEQREQKLIEAKEAATADAPYNEATHNEEPDNIQLKVLHFTAEELPGRRLSLLDPLVDAPSIGAKTAARFAAIEIHSVCDFVTADIEKMATQLDVRWITAATLQHWRSQAILMCQVPGLLARDTQLLVGSGHASADSIAKSNPSTLTRLVTKYADTYAGRRYLRGAEPPTEQRIAEIIGDATLSLVQQKRESVSHRRNDEDTARAA